MTDRIAADMADKGWHFSGDRNAGVKKFAVLGERSSGTNFVQWALRRATDLKDVDHAPWRGSYLAKHLSKLPGITLKEPSIGAYGWKHGIPTFPAIGRRDLIVVVFRNPFDWLVSMYAKPWHINDLMLSMSFAEFIRAPWDARVDRPNRYFDLPNVEDYDGLPLRLDRHPITGKPYANILEMRAIKLQAYLGLVHLGGNVAFVRHDRFSKDPARCLSDMAARYGFRLNGASASSEKRMGSEWKLDARARYEEARSALDLQKAYICKYLDHDTELRAGFSLHCAL